MNVLEQAVEWKDDVNLPVLQSLAWQEPNSKPSNELTKYVTLKIHCAIQYHICCRLIISRKTAISHILGLRACTNRS